MTRRGPYRGRTWLRARLPLVLGWLAPQGRDCGPGRHEWYRATIAWDACYHCRRIVPHRRRAR